jgi:hypothetical protein
MQQIRLAEDAGGFEAQLNGSDLHHAGRAGALER